MKGTLLRPGASAMRQLPTPPNPSTLATLASIALVLAFVYEQLHVAAGFDIGDGRAVTLDATVVLLGAFDWLSYYPGAKTSRCIDMVWRAAKLGGTRLQFVPTQYWRDSMGGNVQSFCWMDSGMTCKSFDQASIAAFKDGMQRCFMAARDAGFTTLQVMPHLDNGDGGDWTIRTWRNGLVFDPLEKHGGLSYEDVMLRPLAEALSSVATPGSGIRQLYFSLQGEMGASVMRYPASYEQLMPRMLDIIRNGAGSPAAVSDAEETDTQQVVINRVVRTTPATDTQTLMNLVRNIVATAIPSGTRQTEQQQMAQGQSNQLGNGAVLKFGLTFNFVYADGTQGTSGTSTVGAIMTGLFGWVIGMRPGFGAPAYDKDAVDRLLRRCDFIGISAYAPLNGATFEASALQNSAFNLIDGFAQIGINLKQILQDTRAELQYVEFGVGGGVSQSGVAAAVDPDQAANKPFWGVQGAFSRSSNPWSTNSMIAFRRSFYSKALEWLSRGAGPTYGISACFIWCKASWDVMGIYPESTTSEGSYMDNEIVDQIKAHNSHITVYRDWQTKRNPASQASIAPIGHKIAINCLMVQSIGSLMPSMASLTMHSIGRKVLLGAWLPRPYAASRQCNACIHAAYRARSASLDNDEEEVQLGTPQRRGMHDTKSDFGSRSNGNRKTRSGQPVLRKDSVRPAVPDSRPNQSSRPAKPRLQPDTSRSAADAWSAGVEPLDDVEPTPAQIGRSQEPAHSKSTKGSRLATSKLQSTQPTLRQQIERSQQDSPSTTQPGQHEEVFTKATQSHGLTEQQVQQLLTYLDYMLETNKVMNLTAVRDRSEALTRHLVDSLALLPVIEEYCSSSRVQSTDKSRNQPPALRVIDVGTGAGLPGMVLAIARPHWRITLLDTLRKRCDFLQRAAQLAGLTNVNVVWSRAEDGARKPEHRDVYDLAVARAVADARVLAELCMPYVRPGGYWVAAKGPDPVVEVEAAKTAIDKLGGSIVKLQLVDSFSIDGQRTALVVAKQRPTAAAYPRQPGTPNKTPL